MSGSLEQDGSSAVFPDKLMPQNPQQVFQVEARDDVFVFDREFKLPAKPKPVRKRTKPKPEIHVPIRLN
ncbi:MAG: hypothetical protein ABI895_31400 [Deltaproteobacteria bacterium]